MKKELLQKQQSWLMCAGFVPPPESVQKDIEAGLKNFHTEKKNKTRCNLTDKQKEAIFKAAKPLLKKGMEYADVYSQLCIEGYATDQLNDSIASFSSINRILKKAKNSLNLKKETMYEKAARLRNEGFSDEEIIERFSVPSRYVKKHISLDTVLKDK